MSRDALIDFLWQRWAIVTQFFNQYYGMVAAILPQFFQIINQQAQAVLGQAQQFTVQYVTQVRVFLTNYVLTVASQTQTLLLAQLYLTRDMLSDRLEALQAYTIAITSELRARSEMYFDELTKQIHMTEGKLTAEMHSLFEPLQFTVKRTEEIVLKTFAMSGLNVEENIRFLKVFVNDPQRYIETLFYEFLWDIIGYLLAHTLSRNTDPEVIKPRFGRIKPTE